MKSDRPARWLHAAANLGVLVGLLLLVVELDQNRDVMRAQTRHDLSTAIVEHLLAIVENPQLASVMRRGDAGEDLSPDEWYQYHVRSRALFRYWENVHYQYRAGLYDEVEFASHRDAWAAYLGGSSAPVSVWCEIRGEFSPGFRGELDGVLSTFRCGEEHGIASVPIRAATDRAGSPELTRFATRYAAAWSGGDPEELASFYAEDGRLTVNAGAPSVGRAAIAATAREFMTAFPDMVVRMDSLTGDGTRATFHWTWTGTNTGPGGTGGRVRMDGFEEWTLGAGGLIVESKGHFDEAKYRRQLGEDRAGG